MAPRPVLLLYLGSAVLLLCFAVLVFRVVVRRSYREFGYLKPLPSLLQLAVFLGYFSFPEIFAPPGWAWFWHLNGTAPEWLQIVGLILIAMGFLIAFGTMAWFGMGRAFGRVVEGLVQSGPYKWSRNPQVVGGLLLPLGTALQSPSLYGLGWLLMYGVIMHWMILTEEEHLEAQFGEEYRAYHSKIPRYLIR